MSSHAKPCENRRLLAGVAARKYIASLQRGRNGADGTGEGRGLTANWHRKRWNVFVLKLAAEQMREGGREGGKRMCRHMAGAGDSEKILNRQP